MNRQTLCFTVANFPMKEKQHKVSKNRTKTPATERYWRLPSSPIVGEKNMCIFYVVVVAVVVVVVVAADVVVVVAVDDDDVEDVDDVDDDG